MSYKYPLVFAKMTHGKKRVTIGSGNRWFPDVSEAAEAFQKHLNELPDSICDINECARVFLKNSGFSVNLKLPQHKTELQQKELVNIDVYIKVSKKSKPIRILTKKVDIFKDDLLMGLFNDISPKYPWIRFCIFTFHEHVNAEFFNMNELWIKHIKALSEEDALSKVFTINAPSTEMNPGKSTIVEATISKILDADKDKTVTCMEHAFQQDNAFKYLTN